MAGVYFNESLRDKPDLEAGIVEEAPEDRWGLYSRIAQRLPGGIRGYLDTMLVSDDLFFQDIETATFEPGPLLFEADLTEDLFVLASARRGLPGLAVERV